MNPMLKVQNVIIRNKIVILFIVIFTATHCNAQKIKIESKNDYIILNKALEKHFEGKHIRDSLLYISKAVQDNLSENQIKLLFQNTKKFDTIYIKSTADKFLYNRFLNDPKWKRKKHSEKKYQYLQTLFSYDEIKHYKQQLSDNRFLWDQDKIGFKGRVFVDDRLKYTQNEITLMDKEKKTKLMDLYRRNYGSSQSRLFTFSKPIFSIDKKIVLISYQYGGNFILCVFEKNKNSFDFKLVLSDNYFIDSI